MRITHLSVMCAALVACGGNGRPDINSSDGACHAIAEVACYDLFSCCSEHEIETYLQVTDPRTENQCRDDVERRCDRKLAVLDFSIANGRVTFDANVMNTCLDAVLAPDNSCAVVDTLAPWTAACMIPAWVGTVAAGGKCDYPIECVKDTFCGPTRTCMPLATDGMSCTTVPCASGLFCNLGMCKPLLGEGGMCTSTNQCMKNFFCDTTATPSTCTALRNIGEPCVGPTTCAAGAQCLPGTCAGNSPATCYSDMNCSKYCSNNGNFCNSDGNCGLGTCTVTNTSCFQQTDCGANTCIFPNMCKPADCVGDVVCGEAHTLVDYCSGALSVLPSP